MGDKKRNTYQFNWGSTLNSPYSPNVSKSGVTAGVMTGTNTIYSDVIYVSNTDNQGLEIAWSGTPTGTIQILGSTSGINFFPLTFSPPITQPAGSAGFYGIDLNQFPWKYLAIEYTNSSGSGLLSVWTESKDLN